MFFNPFSDGIGLSAFGRQPQFPPFQQQQQQQQQQPPRQQSTASQYHNTPPASNRQVSSLPMVRITIDDLQEQSNKECLICLEEQKLGTFACKLPCGHIFHRECIVEWLRKHANCPFCRYELETNDESYEKLRKKNMQHRKLRLRRDELDHKSVNQLRELCISLNVGIHGCVDKRDIVDRLVSSGKIDIVEGVPVKDLTLSEFDAMSVRDLQHLLLSFGLPTQGLLEKNELRNTLLESGRIHVINDSTTATTTINSSNNTSSSSLSSNVYSDMSPGTADMESYERRANSTNENMAFEDMSVSQLINYCRDRRIDISKCINKTDLINNITSSSYNRQPTSSSSSAAAAAANGLSESINNLSSLSLESLSIKELKKIANDRRVDVSGCLEKNDILQRLMHVT